MSDDRLRVTGTAFYMPPSPEWTWRLVDSNGVVFKAVVAPNRFHRFMQRWCLGIIWKRIEK